MCTTRLATVVAHIYEADTRQWKVSPAESQKVQSRRLGNDEISAIPSPVKKDISEPFRNWPTKVLQSDFGTITVYGAKLYSYSDDSCYPETAIVVKLQSFSQQALQKVLQRNAIRMPASADPGKSGMGSQVAANSRKFARPTCEYQRYWEWRAVAS